MNSFTKTIFYTTMALLALCLELKECHIIEQELNEVVETLDKMNHDEAKPVPALMSAITVGEVEIRSFASAVAIGLTFAHKLKQYLSNEKDINEKVKSQKDLEKVINFLKLNREHIHKYHKDMSMHNIAPMVLAMGEGNESEMESELKQMESKLNSLINNLDLLLGLYGQHNDDDGRKQTPAAEKNPKEHKAESSYANLDMGKKKKF